MAVQWDALASLLGELPRDHYFEVSIPKRDVVRVEVRELCGPSWWRDQRTRRVAAVVEALEDWSTADMALQWAARKCLWPRGYEYRGHRMWLKRANAVSRAGSYQS